VRRVGRTARAGSAGGSVALAEGRVGATGTGTFQGALNTDTRPDEGGTQKGKGRGEGCGC
jgi:hypothetical protein